MIRIDYLLLGYRIVDIDKEDIKLAVKLFLKHNLNVKLNSGSFAVSEKRYKEISEILGNRVKFKASKLMGLPGFLYENRKRYGVFCALLFTLFFLLYSSDRVWDVRIEGSEAGYENKILNELSSCGLRVGKSFSKLDFSKTELLLLKSSDYVSWVNIYRRGNVAYVTVADKITHPEEEIKTGYSNIVASCDAVIEEITVVKGVAMVKPGESVKAGQLLISGILPSESGGGFCYAEGVVVGRITDSIESVISKTKALSKTEKSEICKVKINFLNFSAKIFQSYGKTQKECVIIERKTNLSLFGKTLPLSLEKSYRLYSSEEIIELSEEEMAESALLDMQARLRERLSDANLLKIRSEGRFENSAYILKTYFVLSESIGEDLPFQVEE